MIHRLTRTLSLTLAAVLTLGILAGCGGETPQEALKDLAKAIDARDKEAAMAAIDQSTEQGKVGARMIGMLVDMKAAQDKLQAAAVEKFGEEAKAKLDFEKEGKPGLDEFLGEIDKAEVKVDGDKATVIAPDKKDEPIQMVQKDGKWLLKPDFGKVEDPKQMEAMLGMFESMTKAMNEAVGDVEKAKTLDELKQMIDQRMQAAMMSMFGNMMQPN